jgi:peptide/nickel transport system ATP-binding protein
VPVPLLEIKRVGVNFSATAPPAVRDVSFSITAGEVLGLVGESGSGKSATALAILRLLPPQARISGEIRFDGQNLAALDQEDMRSVRGRRIAMIFQEPMTALNPVMRVGDQVAEALLVHGKQSSVVGPRSSARAEMGSVSKRQAWDRAVEMLELVRIPDAARRARDYPHQLSGGQRQRVMIAMALVNRPELLIADEPTTALDVTIQAEILALLAELREKFGLAMLFISHDLAVVSQVAHRVAVMYAGSIVEMATTAELFRQPMHPYTRGLLASVPTLRTDRGKPLPAIDGTVPTAANMPPGCAFEPRCGIRVDACARALPELVEVAPGHLARCPVTANQNL